MKVLWAFDPFHKNNELNVFGRKIIHSLFDKNDSLAAMYVASNAESELSLAFHIPEEERYSLYPKNMISNALRKLKMEQLKVEVLTSKKVSLSSIIEELVKHTQSQKIDLIVTATNNKKLLPKLVFGSFCETLIHSSTCDLLTYHQKTAFKYPKNILYAHDFSKKGDAGLQRVMVYAKKWKAALTIIHVSMYEGGMTYEEHKANTQLLADKVKDLVISNKLQCEMVINYEIKPIYKIVLSAAKKYKADVVAVSAQASKLTVFLGGSVSRQVLREAKIPSLILKI